ncbi:MAG: hypothetical protein JNN06_16275 [Gemmobacter sp.]|uniref:hypothetical protein n=1 Tax=Gemmobacter sp. TaxID=1898957 RepID=UPI001A4B88D1|nr:hypothetical protein [Gemmobacter sp.]MBL8563826.1 hypothetical protein [Gemmobacter sp.]
MPLHTKFRQSGAALMRHAMILAVALVLAGQGASAQGLPTRRDMVQVLPGLWVDAAADKTERGAIRGHIAAASQQVQRQLGAGQPVEWWICTTAQCDASNGMAARGMTYGASLITLNSKGAADPGAYTHELSHATLHGALPMGGLFSTALPLWFDEGVAVLVSGEPSAAAQAPCKAKRKGPLPQTAADFARMAPNAQKALPVYRRSACAVRAWLAKGHALRDVVPLLRAGRKLP